MTDHIDRTVLPIRRPPFAGVTEQTLGGSQPDWGLIGHVKPPAGAPNVLLVLIDDAGFANPSTFGGPISTPNYDRMAAEGLRYNRFHVTAMCSPTRAVLLTGRNHHAVGMGVSRSSRVASRAIRRCCRGTRRRSRRFSRRMAIRRRRSASGT